MQLLEIAPKTPQIKSPAERSTQAWISSEQLAHGFKEYNQRLGVPEICQARVEELLQLQSEIHPELANHSRRVGGYSGALVRSVGGEYSTGFHEGLIRVMAASHDIGKIMTDRATLMRSLDVQGWGKFCRDRDMTEMRKHPVDGFNIIGDDPYLPPETKYVAGGHHQYPGLGELAYGVPLQAVDEAYAGNDPMIHWVHTAIRLTTVADIFDAATTRDNDYFGPAENFYNVTLTRIQHILPDSWPSAITALEAEYHHYYTPAFEF